MENESKYFHKRYLHSDNLTIPILRKQIDTEGSSSKYAAPRRILHCVYIFFLICGRLAGRQLAAWLFFFWKYAILIYIYRSWFFPTPFRSPFFLHTIHFWILDTTSDKFLSFKYKKSLNKRRLILLPIPKLNVANFCFDRYASFIYLPKCD